jgi:uncharacterized protein YbaP (TraB family)
MPFTSSLLWRFSGQGIEGYLFGSIHLHLPSSKLIVSEVSKYLAVCDTLLTEIKMEDQKLDPSMILLPDHITLSTLIDNRRYRRISFIFKKALDLDIEIQCRWKPLMLLNLLAAKISGFDLYENTLDQQIYFKASELGITNEGLEDFEYHFGHLDRIPYHVQMQILNKACKNIKLVKKNFLSLIKAYSKQNIHRIYKSSRRQLGKWRKPFINERNHVMINKLLIMPEGRKYFICVGAGHLAGNHGMIALLKKASFKIEPVHFKQ